MHMDVAEVDWPSRAESGADKTALDVSRPENQVEVTLYKRTFTFVREISICK